MTNLKLSDLAKKIKQTQPGVSTSDPPKTKRALTNTQNPSFFNKLKSGATLVNKKQSDKVSEVLTPQADASVTKPLVQKPESLIDALHLNGILPEIAIDEVVKLLHKSSEIYMKDNVVEQIVNVLVLEEADIKGTCLDATLDVAKDLTYIGLFSQRCDSNLRRFAAKGTLFNLNHPMSFDYGNTNQQILLLANTETLETLETLFVSAPQDLKPLKFKIGTIKVPSNLETPMDKYVAPQTDGILITDLKKHLSVTSDQRLLDSDETLFDFDMLF